ncbi:hypothetical protein OHA74_20740 [Streptomyces phaeochromogenes]|uniref:phage tail tube protein n=1 Tax=Streptomyces phaeochromogenes TaxID=1923 RepID=UPI002E27CC72|nr:hypothetical protein [Streptomyces phaeochromogenes]
MAGNSTNVRVGYAGFAYKAAVGTAGPTDLATAWGVGWTDLGLIGADDGVTESNDEERDSFYAMGYEAPVRTQKRQKTTQFALTFIETNPTILGLYHDVDLDDMTEVGTGAGIAFTQSQNGDVNEFALGLDIVDGAKKMRFWMPRVMVAEKGEVTYKGDEMVGYELTFQALLSSDNVVMKRMYGGLELPE